MSIPRIVAHRGFAENYPENTLIALVQALKCGVSYIEFDVQLTADGKPVIFHDASLERTADVDKNILDITYAEAKTYQACETKRFGQEFVNMGVAIPALADIIYTLKNWPQATAFVEIKEESLKKHGIERTIKTVMQTVQPAAAQCVIISYNALAIRCARAMGAKRIGWVLHEWSNESRSLATELAPDFLFCNYKKIAWASQSLWPGPWQWAMYEVLTPELALELHAHGVALIESMDAGRMMSHPLLRQGGIFDGHLV